MVLDEITRLTLDPTRTTAEHKQLALGLELRRSALKHTGPRTGSRPAVRAEPPLSPRPSRRISPPRPEPE